ncbi:hypothetical protein Dsin_020523 [Dipteronia sinensis]|uniref:C2 domain-containing protein n=1 Tax=Dipteronia sinensis TaxID=43782 RepID=A0AAE0A9E3_9ROSI|nr:hypothetical protein Dsin_020523 [Dipteronia sinensis]
MASLNPLDLEITLISGKHLKNVNWRNGDLKPYAVLYLEPDYRLATHSDDSGSTRPVWNERFTLPLTRPVLESFLTVEIFHSRVSEIPKPLVGSLKFSLAHMVVDDDGSDGDSGKWTQSVRSLELLRPSGRPQGKIRVKLAIKERPLPPPPPPPPTIQDYQNTPDYSHYYYSAPPPFPAPPRDYGYYSSYYSPHPPPLPHQLQPQPPRPSFNRTYSIPVGSVPSAPVDFSPLSNDFKPPPSLPPRTSASTNYAVSPGVSGPSAPVDYTPYDQKLQKQFGGLNLEEEEVNSNPMEKKPENNEFAKREGFSYSDYRHARDY